MGIDLVKAGRVKKPGRKHLVSKNPYLRLLVKLYSFLGRRSNSSFNKVVLKRLMMPRRYKSPISLSKLSKHMRNNPENTAVVVGTVTDDKRMLEVPRLSVCALRVTESAKKRILASGGEVLTFDQLVARSPKGSKCTLLRGETKAREAVKHFRNEVKGNPKPYVRSKGRKFEKARGRRHSRAFKVKAH
ncbi:60S ribosomal protein L18 [Theileria orientalis]|uniref:60S ribosomal protein L18 n=1 Tax=Theileria orientalis TaxID=68886 RepID=A0A976QTJ6_THEOR|nr:60S ribosomal protein L18 [Theileria orientalis]